MRTARSAGILLCWLVHATAAASAQEPRVKRLSFRAHGFSLAVPSGWEEIPDSALQARAVPVPPSPGVRDLAGFRPIAAPDWFTPPYLIVKVQEIGPVDPAELERLALDPSRRVALLQWLTLLQQSYGVSYDPSLFAWKPADRIMWVVASGPADPFPDVISVAGGVVYPRGVVLVAYRIFPSMDLALAREIVRRILLSVQAEE